MRSKTLDSVDFPSFVLFVLAVLCFFLNCLLISLVHNKKIQALVNIYVFLTLNNSGVLSGGLGTFASTPEN